MKIAGVRTDGNNRGDPVELPVDKKVEEAVKMQVVRLTDTDKEFEGCGTWARDITVKSFSFNSDNKLLGGKWQNNTYRAEGEVVIHSRQRSTDRVRKPVKRGYSIVFKDILDSWGMPELEVESMVLI